MWDSAHSTFEPLSLLLTNKWEQIKIVLVRTFTKKIFVSCKYFFLRFDCFIIDEENSNLIKIKDQIGRFGYISVNISCVITRPMIVSIKMSESIWGTQRIITQLAPFKINFQLFIFYFKNKLMYIYSILCIKKKLIMTISKKSNPKFSYFLCFDKFCMV